MDDLVSIVADAEYADALEMADVNAVPEVNQRPELFSMTLPIGLILDVDQLIATSNEIMQAA